MNISEIKVPEFWPTLEVTQGIIAAAVLGLVLIVFNVSSQGKKQFSRRQWIAGGVLLAIAIGTGATSIILAHDMKDRQERNFAAALQRTYGATSSRSYQDILWSHDREATLTRDGKDTLVRFEFDDDGTMRPVIPSQTDYPTLEAAKP